MGAVTTERTAGARLPRAAARGDALCAGGRRPAMPSAICADGFTAEAVASAPSLAWNRDDALQDSLLRRAFRRNIKRPVHYVPTAEGFASAVRAGLGWGMFPESLADVERGATDRSSGSPMCTWMCRCSGSAGSSTARWWTRSPRRCARPPSPCCAAERDFLPESRRRGRKMRGLSQNTIRGLSPTGGRRTTSLHMRAWLRASACSPSSWSSADSGERSPPPTRKRTARSAMPTVWRPAVTHGRNRSDPAQRNHFCASDPTPCRIRREFDTGSLFRHPKEPRRPTRGTGEESTGLTGPMAIGSTTGSETGTDAAVGRRRRRQRLRQRPARRRRDVNEPETVVSHSPVTEPSSEPGGPDGRCERRPPAGDLRLRSRPLSSPSPTTLHRSRSHRVGSGRSRTIGGRSRGGRHIGRGSGVPLHRADRWRLPRSSRYPSSLLSLLGFPLMGEAQTAPVTAGGIGGSLFAGGLYTAERAQLASSQLCRQDWPEMLIASGRFTGLSSPVSALHERSTGSPPPAWRNNTWLRRRWRTPRPGAGAVGPSAHRRRRPGPAVAAGARVDWRRRASRDWCFSVPQACSSATARPRPRPFCGLSVSPAS